MNKLWHHPLLVVTAASCSVGGAFFLGLVLVALTWAPAAPIQTQTVALDPSALAARAAVLYDPGAHTILYQKDSAEQLPLASLTKLMAARAVLSARSPQTSVRITEQDLAPEGDWGLRVGDTLTLGALLHLGLVASSNDAMAAAAASLGNDYTKAMDITAQDLGLSKAYFLNSTGLDLNSEISGAYGSALDVALLTAAFYKEYPQFFELTSQPTVSVEDGSRTLTAEATTRPLQNLAGFVGAKTGYTDLAGGNLAAVVDLWPGHPVVAVVLHSSEAGRFNDIKTLIAAARSTFSP
ncbi:MAG: D-alanyl-D-alanine carboxypeptidase [Patescibacteria group bacterium]|nr:D-alanyl-D-alanine carboxypeptidase [Patescibacteria group bacterium]